MHLPGVQQVHCFFEYAHFIRGFYLVSGSLMIRSVLTQIYSRIFLMLQYFLPMCQLFSFRQLHQTSEW